MTRGTFTVLGTLHEYLARDNGAANGNAGSYTVATNRERYIWSGDVDV